MKRRAGTGATLAAALGLLLGGCSDGNGAAPGPGDLDDPPVDGATVRVVDLAYEPDEVVVRPGEAVAFTNDGDVAHTVTGDDGEFDSGEQLPGETFRFLTDDDTPAAISYHCEIHPDEMKGRIVVDRSEPDDT
ncbi:MAG: cupredoxin domain-containing protein [Acidimicrobiales bacterium]